MPAGNAYPSGHLVPSPILGLANAPIVETKFLEFAMSLLDFSPRIPLGTFSILLFHHVYFVKEHSDSKNKYTEDDIINMPEFLVDNIFVVFGGKAPLLADIFLYSYEADFIQSLLSTGKKKNSISVQLHIQKHR